MASIGRNDPCPCGSRKKYKKCCQPVTEAAFIPKRAAFTPNTRHFPNPPRGAPPLANPPRGARPVSPLAGYDEDALDDLSNGVMDLIAAKDFDKALATCGQLLADYPESIDGLERSAMVHEALGNLDRAIDFYRGCLDFADQPDRRNGFDDEGRSYFREKIAEVEARLHRQSGPAPVAKVHDE